MRISSYSSSSSLVLLIGTSITGGSGQLPSPSSSSPLLVNLCVVSGQILVTILVGGGLQSSNGAEVQFY